MSWGCSSKLKCNRCGNIYTVEEDTLTINKPLHDKCPKCSGDGIVISNHSMLDAMKKQELLFKGRKKRSNL